MSDFVLLFSWLGAGEMGACAMPLRGSSTYFLLGACLILSCLVFSSRTCLTLVTAKKAIVCLLSCSDGSLHNCASGVRPASHSSEVWPTPGHQHEVSLGQCRPGTKVRTPPTKKKGAPPPPPPPAPPPPPPPPYYSNYVCLA